MVIRMVGIMIAVMEMMINVMGVMAASAVSSANYPASFPARLSCAGSQGVCSLSQHALGEMGITSLGYRVVQTQNWEFLIHLNCMSLDCWGWRGAAVLPTVVFIWRMFHLLHISVSEESAGALDSVEKVEGFLPQLMHSRGRFSPQN